MFKKTYIILFTVLLGFLMVSCVDDLSTTPLDDDVVTSESVYETPEDYKQVLAKLYAGFSMTGQQGPAGNADIQGIDEGFSSYIRQYFTHQENPTDEAIVGWNDEGLPEFNTLSWTASNDFVMAMYSRIYYEIAMTNEFIRNSEGREEAEIQAYVAEARFLRALSYWHALDLFGGNVPFVTEDDAVGAEPPMPTNADDLFAFIESELLDIAGTLPASGSQEYGRADRGAAWMLLAKLYLNAEVYIGQERYDDALTYAEDVSNAYTLHDNYQELFMADNHTADGIIFPVTFDGINSTTFGGTTFLVFAQLGGSMNSADYGVNGGWAGNRTTPEFVNKFNTGDSRGMFHTDGQTLEVDELGSFTSGYAIEKWTNKKSNGENGSDLEFVDTDFPMFRLADAYLMYAEAVVRGASGGTEAQAVNYINALRFRAFGDNSGDITTSDLTLDFILDERARELYWEGHRRTDLRRFGRFTSGEYVWAWKGDIQAGQSVSDKYEIYPLPFSDVNANPNLTQNPGY
ncbi:RagB/SusD family nutrient uptake outer membrane protein [Gracilimonas sp. Q87]|uniref:RagB/SusD family nutrient uptake outer membrane protein n=1 Tax=Gracilimonas sp. Q87 TaxID=3384766 RepID=UPI0039840FEB